MTQMIEWADERETPVHICWSIGYLFNNDAFVVDHKETVMLLGAAQELEARYGNIAVGLYCDGEPEGTKTTHSGYDQWPAHLSIADRDTYDAWADESTYVINVEPQVDRQTRVEWPDHLAEVVAKGLWTEEPSPEQDLYADSFADTR